MNAQAQTILNWLYQRPTSTAETPNDEWPTSHICHLFHCDSHYVRQARAQLRAESEMTRIEWYCEHFHHNLADFLREWHGNKRQCENLRRLIWSAK